VRPCRTAGGGADTSHLLSMQAALITTQTPQSNPGVMACHILQRTQADTLYLSENLIS